MEIQINFHQRKLIVLIILLTFYAATKKSNEVMAHSYSHIYKLPCTGVRFFTVYGPLGRPDMALYKFTNNIIKNKSIEFIIMAII